ncbi:MAG TPA: mechanosensitive ion channel family protein [Vicinamibacterales bacterium]|nr:mechanosensitive ion channel family protein [Vicinamibacterales bacterium]
MSHYPGHLIAGAVAFVAALGISSFTINRLVRRKLRLSVFLLGAYVLLHAALVLRPELLRDYGPTLVSFERLAFAAALINLLVVCLINPLRQDRVPDRYPSILQDAVVIGLVVLVATFALGEKFLTTSAVSAVVLGFALQDTLGNAFAGLAIQSEKPFNIGHWVKVGEFEGRVAEVTWRATKLRTKTGNFVVLPNNLVSKEAITNYSEPAAPTRLQIEVGVTYDAPPNVVKRVALESIQNCPLVLTAPAPDVLLTAFDSSSVTYRVRFWIEDYERDEAARDQVRTSIYYAFRRKGIEIPYPIQVQYERPWAQPDAEATATERERLLGKVDIFASLSDEQRRTIAARTRTSVYANGEVIVREGQPGESMFVVCSGRAAVVLQASGTEVAEIPPGGYFGEMSLLTGDPRSANVVARGDAVVLEIDAEVFRQLAEETPHTVEQVGLAAATRRTELDQVRAASRKPEGAEAPATFLARMRKFLRV